MVRKARIKIEIGGRLRPYTDGEWVVFTPSGVPMGFMRVERKHLVSRGVYVPDPAKAFADFWSWNETTALQAAMEGYTIQLVGREKSGELLEQHLGKETGVKEERQHGEDQGS